MLRPRRVLSSPIKLAFLIILVLTVYYSGPTIKALVQPREGAPLIRGQARGRGPLAGNQADAAAQRAQFDAEAEKKRFADAKARDRVDRLRKQAADDRRVAAGEAARDDDSDDNTDGLGRGGAGARGWAAADDARRQAQKVVDNRAKAKDGAAGRVAVPAHAEPQPAGRPFGQKAVPGRPLPPPAKPNDRLAAAEPAKAVKGAPQANTFEEELRLAADRKARQDVKMREWDERMAAAERGADRKKVDLQVDKDDLDAVQKGVAAQRGAAAAGRKKGPLIQVGGARNAAGDDRGGRAGAAAAAAAAKDRQEAAKGPVKGWDQRFKRPAAAAKGANGGVAPRDGEAGSDEPEPIETEESKQEAAEAAADAEITRHKLVRRLSSYDFASSAQLRLSASKAKDPTLEDHFDAAGSSEEQTVSRVNLTVCAFIPHEKRFLGEWLLYHRLLGVERFALYDTSHPGVFGAAEIDELIDKMKDESGEGELAPTIEELKAHVGTANSDLGGLDERGQIRKEKIAGFERWIDQGAAKIHWMNFGNARDARDPHSAMLDHCVETFSSSTNWLVQLDIDEFLAVAPTVASTEPPLLDASGEPISYALHDLLEGPELSSAACVPLPLLNYRNYGIRELPYAEGVLESQLRRDVVKRDAKGLDATVKHQRILLHTGYSSDPSVKFSGPHACTVEKRTEGASAIKDSAGVQLQKGGRYKAVALPIEPLAVAHYVQRDLRDCFAKLSSLADPNDLHPRSRGMLSCEEHYIPTEEELESLPRNEQNRFLLTKPPSESITIDRRVADSWAARATRVIRSQWQKARDSVPGRGAGRGGDHDTVPKDVVERARSKVEIVNLKSRPRDDKA